MYQVAIHHAIRESECDLYFGHLYPAEAWLLVASASELIRIGTDGHEVWRRGGVGLDGVVVDGVIEGRGEWDPPDGWRTFRAGLETGEVLRAEPDQLGTEQYD